MGTIFIMNFHHGRSKRILVRGENREVRVVARSEVIDTRDYRVRRWKLQMQGTQLKIGFVPLIDAGPLIAAQELGYFAEEGLGVSLHRQIGWANIRDKLSFGQ